MGANRNMYEFKMGKYTQQLGQNVYFKQKYPSLSKCFFLPQPWNSLITLLWLRILP